ncbi:MAG: hypothetical protein HND55_04320 [Pseudomonadota bacterium]|nr:MAG: hypothetical protein HND55_04320 [Pseudomonadota bacterium]
MDRFIRYIAAIVVILAHASVPAETKVQYHEVIDQQRGIVQAAFPYPASWRINGEHAPVFASGPGGIQLYPADNNQFFWSSDPSWQQTAWQQGRQVMAPMPLNQALQQLIVPAAQAQGNRLLRSYPVPEISGFWQRFIAGMPQTGVQRSVDALGTEWTDDLGQRTFVAVVQMVSRDRQATTWQLTTQSLSAPEAVFEQALADYRHAIGNGRINPQWQAMMNNRHISQRRHNEAFWAEASARSRAAHQQRMAAIASAGQSARQVGNTYSDILDISHAGYLKRDAIQSGGHAAGINQISGHTVIGNHETGEHYRVEDGSNHYWVNPDGLYIATDSALFDPRTDPRISDQEWTRFVKEQ